MSYTPVELRHVHVGVRPLGYHKASVEKILNDVADSFEVVWSDRGELADRVEELERQLAEAKGREQLLTNTLVAAEQAAEEMRERARREAELIVAEAHAESRSVMHTGQGDRERLLAEVRRIESLLRSALGIVEEANRAGEPSATAVEPRPVEPQERPQVAPAPIAAAPAREPDPAPAAPAVQPPVAVEEDTPGWPPLRRVAQGGADFDWGD